MHGAAWEFCESRCNKFFTGAAVADDVETEIFRLAVAVDHSSKRYLHTSSPGRLFLFGFNRKTAVPLRVKIVNVAVGVVVGHFQIAGLSGGIKQKFIKIDLVSIGCHRNFYGVITPDVAAVGRHFIKQYFTHFRLKSFDGKIERAIFGKVFETGLHISSFTVFKIGKIALPGELIKNRCSGFSGSGFGGFFYSETHFRVAVRIFLFGVFDIFGVFMHMHYL